MVTVSLDGTPSSQFRPPPRPRFHQTVSAPDESQTPHSNSLNPQFIFNKPVYALSGWHRFPVVD